MDWRWLAAAIVAAAGVLLWFSLSRQGAGPAARGPAGAGQSSIAVLPFVDMSAGKDQGYLADGIAEEVRSRLAQAKDLRVISRSSSFLFRDKPADVRGIADKLDVTHVLEGSVRRSGDSLRITAQLIATVDSSHVWSMRFDRKVGDIFAIQDEISLQVTRALEVSLTPGALERMTREGTTNLEAYLEFLQGHALLATNRVSDARAAITRFEQAVALDPAFAAAYLGIAEAALFAAEFEITDDRQSRFESARRRGRMLVEKALSIDPANGEALPAPRAPVGVRRPGVGRRGLSPRPRAQSELRRRVRGPGRGALYVTAPTRRGARTARSCSQARPAQTRL